MSLDLSSTTTPAKPAVNWRQVATFLGLAFGLAWLTDLVIYLNGGLAAPSTKLLMQFQMMTPALAALLLGVFFFRDSPVYHGNNHTASRWFVYYYFVLCALYLAGSIFSLVQPDQVAMISQVLLMINIPGLILLVALRLAGGKNALSAAGMGGGKWKYWLILGLGVVAVYALETLLNYAFNLGEVADIRALYPAGAADAVSPTVLYVSVFFNGLLLGPFLGLIITFGEEYGWRGFLQSQLNRMGRIRGTLLLGVIWGIWHWPVIWMGYNYPGQPVLGSLLFVLFCIILSYFLAYAVFKSGGIWAAAFLHALSNQTMSIFMATVYTPADMALSFGIGVPGIVLCGLIILLLLRDPVWKEA